MTYEEMMEKMAQVGSDGGSALHMRSEDLQHKVKVKSIPRLKNALKKKSKLLLDAELAFPFKQVKQRKMGLMSIISFVLLSRRQHLL